MCMGSYVQFPWYWPRNGTAGSLQYIYLFQEATRLSPLELHHFLILALHKAGFRSLLPHGHQGPIFKVVVVHLLSLCLTTCMHTSSSTFLSDFSPAKVQAALNAGAADSIKSSWKTQDVISKNFLRLFSPALIFKDKHTSVIIIFISYWPGLLFHKASLEHFMPRFGSLPSHPGPTLSL